MKKTIFMRMLGSAVLILALLFGPACTVEVDRNALPEGQHRINLPAAEESKYIAYGWHGITSPGEFEMSVGPRPGFVGNAVKGIMKSQSDDRPIWVFGMDISELEESKNLETFTDLEKVTFDYTCTEDFTDERFFTDLTLQLVFKGEVKIGEIVLPLPGVRLEVEFGLNFEKTDALKTIEIDFSNLTADLNNEISANANIWLDFIQFGFFNGSSFDQEPFTPATVEFGNVIFHTTP